MTFASLINFSGATGAMLTTLCWLPQVLKVIREKETRALSLPATAACTLGVALWLIYGLPGDEAALRLMSDEFSAITF